MERRFVPSNSAKVRWLMETNAKWAVRCLCVLMFSLSWLAAYSQSTTATLSGVVRDSTGAVLPEVKITLKNAANGTSRSTTTDGEGRYKLSAVEPGTYEVRADRSGFSSEVKGGIEPTVGGTAQFDFTLRVGTVNEVIKVTDEAPLIETSKAEVSNVINETVIQSLPNIGRNFVDFVKLSSGVAPGRENTG